MNRVLNRKKQRQEYLRKKRVVKVRLALILMNPGVTGILVTLVGLVTYFVPPIPHALTALLMVLTFISAYFYVRLDVRILARSMRDTLRNLDQEASSLGYVTPLTRSSLHPEEILVRGTSEPAADSAMLVRPIQTSEKAKAETPSVRLRPTRSHCETLLKAQDGRTDAARRRVPDRKKQRRAYLRRRSVIAARIALVRMGAGIIGISVGLLVLTLCVLYRIAMARMEVVSSAVLMLLAFIIAYLVMKHDVFGAESVLSELQQQADNLSYVPSVTPHTLPAEEVLVRGAEEPNVLIETLLRATQAGEEVKADELLRSL